jgi:hypothetical protein
MSSKTANHRIKECIDRKSISFNLSACNLTDIPNNLLSLRLRSNSLSM